MSDSPQMEVVADLERALRAPGSVPLPRDILDLRPVGDEETRIKRALNRMLHHTTVRKVFDGPAQFGFKDVDALCAASQESDCPDYVVETLNYLRLYQVLAAQMCTLPLNGRTWFGYRISEDTSARLIAAIEDVCDFDPDLTSSALVLGKLHALRDRAIAAPLFAHATTRFEEDQKIFKIDRGAKTFFDSATLEQHSEMIATRRASLPERRQDGPICPPDARFLILMSCDPKYLRLHLLNWLSVAEYLKPLGFSYHFLVVDDTGEVDELIADARDLERRLGKFRRHDPATFGGNLTFSSAPLPDWCVDIPSFSACARLLYARDVAERSGKRVITLDVDVHITTDPAAWFESIPEDRIVLYPDRVNVTIDPWAKFRAGFFALPPDESAFELAQHLSDYLLLGLGEPDPWFLDQNALGYFYEKATAAEGEQGDLLASVADIGSMAPIQGFPIDFFFRKSQIATR